MTRGGHALRHALRPASHGPRGRADILRFGQAVHHGNRRRLRLQAMDKKTRKWKLDSRSSKGLRLSKLTASRRWPASRVEQFTRPTKKNLCPPENDSGHQRRPLLKPGRACSDDGHVKKGRRGTRKNRQQCRPTYRLDESRRNQSQEEGKTRETRDFVKSGRQTRQ